MDILEILGQMGGGGAIVGAIIFWCYRIDRKATERRLGYLLDQHVASMRDYTRVITELVTLLHRMNGRS